jgi:hypothetical protein
LKRLKKGEKDGNRNDKKTLRRRKRRRRVCTSR